jgi:hypothetical protein
MEMAREAWAEAGEGWVVDAWFDERSKAFEAFAALVREDALAQPEEKYTYGTSIAGCHDRQKGANMKIHTSKTEFLESEVKRLSELLQSQPAPVQEPVNLHQVLTDPENQPNQYGVNFGMYGKKMMFKIGGQQFALDYEPDKQAEFNFMRDMLIHAFSTFTHGVKTTPPAQEFVCSTGLCHYKAKREFVGLTNEERMDILLNLNWDKKLSHMDTALAIEAKLKDKNT